MKKYEISKFQFFTIICTYIFANDMIRGFYVHDIKQDVWIAMSIGIMGSVLVFFLYSFIIKSNNYEDLKTSIENITGKFFSKIIFTLYILYFSALIFFHLFDLVQLIFIFFFPDFYIFILAIPILIVLVYTVSKGIEPFVRYGQVMFVSAALLFIIFSLFLFFFNSFDILNFLPILEGGVKPIILPTVKMTYSVPMGELFVLLFFVQFVKEKNKTFKYGYWAIILAGLTLLTFTLYNIIFLNPESMKYGLTPSMRVFRKIDTNNFIQRYDLINLSFIISFCVIKFSIFLFISKEFFIYKFKPKKQNFIVYAICGLVFIAIFIFQKQYINIFNFRTKFFIPYINFAFEIIIPFVLVFLSLFKKVKKEDKLEFDI